jgi:predicted DCC family thiol-disulfide oxidoreductase YuxK
VNAILRRLGGPWSLAAFPEGFPPAARLEERAYAWFSRNRGRFAFLAGPAEWPGGEAGPSPGEGEDCGCGAGRNAKERASGGRWRAAMWVGAMALATPPLLRRVRKFSRRERSTWARRRGNPRWLP